MLANLLTNRAASVTTRTATLCTAPARTSSSSNTTRKVGTSTTPTSQKSNITDKADRIKKALHSDQVLKTHRGALSTSVPVKYYSNNSQQQCLHDSTNTGITNALLALTAGSALIGCSHLCQESTDLQSISNDQATPHPLASSASLESSFYPLSWQELFKHLVPTGDSNTSNSVNAFDPTTSASAIQGGLLGVMEASVDTAAVWEKKAKVAVDKVRGVSPSSYDISVRAIKGNRLSMEDEYLVANGGRFAAVFDGHGGGGVSTFLRENLHDKINKHLQKSLKAGGGHQENNNAHSVPKMVHAIRAAFNEVDSEVLAIDDYQYQGSTAVAVYLHEDTNSGARTLISANIGDSRAILSRNQRAVEITRDHKPDDDVEKERLISIGETIEWDNYSKVYRVRNLSLSRAIGDRFAKPAVSGDVEIQLFQLSDKVSSTKDGVGNDEFVILASDGLWDVMTSQDCVDFVHKRLKSKPSRFTLSSSDNSNLLVTKRKNMSRFLANEALRRGSGDNICVIVLWLN
jgi:serine/threonine protein phosphatase PrpC